MSTSTPVGPAEAVLMASVARRFYVDGMSKSDIAQQLGMSRFKVARLIDRAIETGLVQIRIGWPGSLDVTLSTDLQERYGLRRALVIDVQDDQPEAQRTALGATAAELLSETVTTADVVGLAWGRSLAAMARSLRRMAACDVVQLTGALQISDDSDSSSVDLVRDVARLGGGAAYYFHIPMIVATGQLGDALRAQPEVARAISRFPAVTKAFVGIGAWYRGGSTVFDALATNEATDLGRAGVCAEISGILIDSSGRPVRVPLVRRTIGISADQLRAVPDVTALAYGADKAQAVAAALHSGLVHGLVTTRDLATALLARPH
ncbi:MAG: transcriptional regulator [Kineosporiaceae bacterium]|nr:transcriptional regulator [Kineosporiaceae bacterium]